MKNESAPLKIYLDQNKWIDLGRAILRPDDDNTYVEVAELIKNKVEKGEWIVPLSLIHFLETLARGNNRSREGLARVMEDVSRGYTIVPSMDVEQEEFHNKFAELHSFRATYPIEPIKEHLFGALGSNPPSIEFNRELDPDIETKIREVFSSAKKSNDLYKKYMANTLTDQEKDENEKMNLELVEGWKQRQERISRITEKYRYKWFLANQFVENFMKHLDYLMQTFKKNRDELIPGDILKCEEKVIALLEGIPSLNVRIKLMYQLLRDINATVHRNDPKDVQFLSMAIPYTDVVITEKKWWHLANQEKLGELYCTEIEKDLNFLLKYKT